MPSEKKRKRGKTPTEKKNEAKQRPQKWEIHRIQMADTSTKSNTVTTTASSSRMDLQKWDTLRHQRRLQSRSAANKSQCNGSLFRMGPKLSATATYHIIPLHSRDTCQTQSRCLKVWVVTDAANARRSSQYPHGQPGCSGGSGPGSYVCGSSVFSIPILSAIQLLLLILLLRFLRCLLLDEPKIHCS